MAHRQSNAAPQLRFASAPVYSYLVTAIGAIEQRDVGTPQASLTFVGELAKKDGYKREHVVLVENSVQEPNLVEQVRECLLAGVPARMLVGFERSMQPEGKVMRMKTIARIEAVMVAQNKDARQLSLF